MNKIQATSSSELPENIQEVIRESKASSKSLVLVTGVFDVLHFEHENFLKKASKLGDALIIAIESDLRVKMIKGEGRPVNSQLERVKNLKKLGVTEYVFVLPNEFSKSENHIELIKTVRPDILAVSSHTGYLNRKRKIVSGAGGKLIVVHNYNPGVSSTKIIEG